MENDMGENKLLDCGDDSSGWKDDSSMSFSTGIEGGGGRRRRLVDYTQRRRDGTTKRSMVNTDDFSRSPPLKSIPYARSLDSSFEKLSLDSSSYHDRGGHDAGDEGDERVNFFLKVRKREQRASMDARVMFQRPLMKKQNSRRSIVGGAIMGKNSPKGRHRHSAPFNSTW